MVFPFSIFERNIMYDEYQKYIYEGPVVLFDRCVVSRWKGETMAPTESKARSNLAYQAKKQLKLVAGTNVKLPGKIKMVQ